jgi:hypothetical protein
MTLRLTDEQHRALTLLAEAELLDRPSRGTSPNRLWVVTT